MADQFIGVIKQLIDSYGPTNGFPAVSYIQSSPARKEWNVTPMITIVPKNKETYFIAFNQRNITSTYQIFFITDEPLKNVEDPAHNDFVIGMIDLFMGMPAQLHAVGAWQTRVQPRYDFDREQFAKGKVISCSELTIDWVLEN